MGRGNSRAFAVALAAGTVYTSGGVLFGWSIGESAGTPAAGTVIIRDGTSSAGTILAVIELAANGSSTESLGPEGISFTKGLFVEITGTAQGAIYVG